MDILAIHAREILDSRGNPTVEADVMLEDGSFGRASVPSGASTGSLEAHELRDSENPRFHGRGVLKAVQNINTEIADSICGMNAFEQQTIDRYLVELDGTENKSRLGANALLAVSLAVAKAGANSQDTPLFQYIGGINGNTMPMPMMNILNGGAHADNAIDIQEFMIMPVGMKSFKEAVRAGAEIFMTLRSLLKKSGHNTNTGDEGGFAPNLNGTEEALDFVLQAIEKSGYTPQKDIAIALDAASTEFYKDGKYLLNGKELSAEELVKFYASLASNYPIISIEDAMAENDIEGWKMISGALGSKIQLVGDDLFVTNSKILSKYAAMNIANSILVKPNQIGTLSETLKTIETAHRLGYKTVISHRSGETEDTTIAHLAVAVNSGQIKTGSVCRTDRTAKYNELLRIEENLGKNAKFGKI